MCGSRRWASRADSKVASEVSLGMGDEGKRLKAEGGERTELRGGEGWEGWEQWEEWGRWGGRRVAKGRGGERE